MSSRWARFASTLDDELRDSVRLSGNGRANGVDPNALEHLRLSFERVREARRAPSVLRASGVKIGRMSAADLRIVAGNRQPWQGLAWRYRDMIGELRFALQFRARAISRVRFYVAEIIGDDDEPIPVDLRNDDDAEKRGRITLPEDLCAAAEEELDRLPLGAGYEFLGVWSENFDVAGDCWLHGYTDKLTGEEVWKIRSVEAIDVQGSNLTIKNELGQPRKINVDQEELHRLWVPHPAHPHLGDSALNALQDVLEDICLVGREMRAVSRSRIMSNGILFVTDSMAEQRNTREDAETPLERRRAFMADLEAAMLAPIANEGDAGGVVPIVLTGTEAEIKAVRYERLQREESPILLEKLAKSLGRMGNSLDIPPEILTGMADVNHWSAWQIDNSTFRHHLEPSIRLMVDSLTGSFLRAALAKRGFPPEQVKRIRIWYDAGQITENPNRRQDALDAMDRILIGPAAGREALGFNDGDAPTPEEALQMIAAKNGIDTSTAAAILAWAAREDGATTLPPFPQPVQLPASRREQEPPEPEQDDAAPGGTGAPDTAPDGIAASAALDATGENMAGFLGVDAAEWQKWLDLQNGRLTRMDAANRALDQALENGNVVSTGRGALAAGLPDGYRVDWSAARDLADIDTALREQILAAADRDAKQALQRAGNRLRSKATSPKLADAVRVELQTLPPVAWAAHLGPEQCLALNADQRFLLAGAWEALSGKFGKWVRTAALKVARRVLRMLKVKEGSLEGQAVVRQITGEMEARIDPAWAHLHDALNDHLEKVMFGRTADDQRGEVPEFDIPASLVREALAEIGGDQRTEGVPVTGLGNGSTVRGHLGDRGAVHVGLEWRYGNLPRDTFQPHENLDGQRFLSWTDEVLATEPDTAWIGPFFHPGDHRGCLCSWFSVYALPTGGTPDMVFGAQDVPREALESLQREFLEGAL